MIIIVVITVTVLFTSVLQLAPLWRRNFYSIAPSLSWRKWSKDGQLVCISEPIAIKYEGI